MSFWRFTAQSSDPPTPTPEGATVTGRFYTKLVSGVLRAFLRDSNGNVYDFQGIQGIQGDQGDPGPAGPPGTVSVVDVADITNPIELESTSVFDVGGGVFARQVNGGGVADLFSNYLYDPSGPARNVPYVMLTGDGGTTRWIANTSRFTNSSPQDSLGGRFISSAEQTKLAGIQTGATQDFAGTVAPPDVAASGSAGTDTNTYANENHTHGHGNQLGAALHAIATTLVNGFMSAVDKLKLDGIAAGATNTPLTATAPVNVTKAAAVVGVSTEAARQDHKHDIATATAVDLTDSTNAEGSSTSLSRADHQHSHGTRGGGTLHAAATTSVAGFLSAADKTKLDALPTSIADYWDANVELHDDFPTVGSSTGQVGALGWISDSAGTAATVLRKTGELGHPGIVTVRPGTIATGRAAIALGGDGTNFCLVGNGQITVTWLIRSAQNLANFEMFVAGLGDVSNAVGDQNNGVYFQLLGSPTPDTNFFIVTASSGTRTRVNTGIPYVAATWYKLKLTINSAGTSVQANIDGVDVGTAITTNIPASAISPLLKVDGIAGGTASDTDIDLFKFLKTLTTSR